MHIQCLLRQLSYNQAAPFVPYIAPELKQFLFDKVYRENKNGDEQSKVVKVRFI
jgi:hypothetical protein